MGPECVHTFSRGRLRSFRAALPGPGSEHENQIKLFIFWHSLLRSSSGFPEPRAGELEPEPAKLPAPKVAGAGRYGPYQLSQDTQFI